MLLKIGMAIAVAMAAALIVVIAGLFADISTGTVLLRALFTFTVLGFGLVFGVFWAERYGIPFYMSKHKEKQSEWLKLYLMLKEMEKNGDGGEAGTENGTEQGPEESSLVDVKVTDEPEAAGLEPLTEEEMAVLNTLDCNNRLVKGQAFLWPGANDWHDLWDEEGKIVDCPDA